jgi:hypothetical protein
MTVVVIEGLSSLLLQHRNIEGPLSSIVMIFENEDFRSSTSQKFNSTFLIDHGQAIFLVATDAFHLLPPFQHL